MPDTQGLQPCQQGVPGSDAALRCGMTLQRNGYLAIRDG